MNHLLKAFLFTVTLAFAPLNAVAQSSPNVSNIVAAGGAVATALGAIFPASVIPTLKILVSTNETAVASYGRFTSLTPITGTIYQVPAGKTFKAYGFFGGSNAGVISPQFGTATASFTHGQTTAPTGAVFGTADGTVGSSTMIMPGGTTPQWFAFPIWFEQNLYPFVRGQGSTGPIVYMVGKEF